VFEEFEEFEEFEGFESLKSFGFKVTAKKQTD